jgi:hypothetical protein
LYQSLVLSAFVAGMVVATTACAYGLNYLVD